jgi:hypothetical protein
VGGNRNSFPIEAVKAMISIPYASRRYFSAIAPAATRPDFYQLNPGLGQVFSSPIVSRALLLPPPELALTPYFSRYVQSA